MPNRIIKESALDSDDLDKLTNGAERLFWRLIVVADDFGRFDATPQVVKARCFPRKVDTLRTSEVEKWMTELNPSLVRYYWNSGRPYGYFLNWDKHQQRRASKSKFPDPSLSDDSGCNHLQSNAPRASISITNPKSPPNPKGKEGDDGGEKPPDDSVLIAGVRYKWPSPEGLEALQLDPNIWADWLKARKEKGKAATPTSIHRAGMKLARWRADGHDLNEIVERAAIGGWQGLFLVTGGRAVSKSDQQSDKIQAALRRGLE
jgi:hypothetical protein